MSLLGAGLLVAGFVIGAVVVGISALKAIPVHPDRTRRVFTAWIVFIFAGAVLLLFAQM